MSRRIEQNKQPALQIMFRLIGLMKPLLGTMIIAIVMGCVGHLVAIFITVFGGIGIGNLIGIPTNWNLKQVAIIIIVFAILRGILRYAEQACNHYIAFKLLARIRNKVFAALRKLAPAKLDGKDKGNLIAVLTSDIELLEVFYAHTISPIVIAISTSIFMCIYIGQFHGILGIIAAIFYGLVGFIIPVINSRYGQKYGHIYRTNFGKLNTIVLDNLYGLDEILQYQQKDNRLAQMNQYTEELEATNEKLKQLLSIQRIVTDSVILCAGIINLLLGHMLVGNGDMIPVEVLITTIAIMSSFGPTAALAALSNDLNQTLASGSRVLNLLDEKPILEDVINGSDVLFEDITMDNISFAYKDKEILEQFSTKFSKNKIHGIYGKSGCGKSTVLKLLMRFYEVDSGKITYHNTDINDIITAKLRDKLSYVTQDTFLFEDTIFHNIQIAKENATEVEVIEAAKKASIHSFISSLPNGYQTQLSELGESVSGGERQRLGMARAFLQEAPYLLLDEPTSNIDSLNEGIILKSIQKEKGNRTIILVSHRKSTMAIAEEVLVMN